MNIYNNKYYDWCKKSVVNELERERLSSGMSVTDEETYNKLINKRTKISFWYYIIFIIAVLIIIIILL